MQRAQMDRRAIEQEVTALNADLAETEMRWCQDIHHRTGLVQQGKRRRVAVLRRVSVPEFGVGPRRAETQHAGCVGRECV